MKRSKKHRIRVKWLNVFITILLIFFISFSIKNIYHYFFKEEKIDNKKPYIDTEALLLKKENERKEHWAQTFKEDEKIYPAIAKNKNLNYPGIGQEEVYDEDGYFTTFKTDGENVKTYKEYKQNGYSSWKNNPYWSGFMEDKGCGITMMSILLSGYGFELTPEDLRQKYYPNFDYNGLHDELNNVYNIKSSNFIYDKMYFNEDNLINHLKTNRPIIVCVWSQIENRWTEKSHYMLLLAADDNHMIYISNPNGLMDSGKSSGWYDVNELLPYIAKIMLVESY